MGVSECIIMGVPIPIGTGIFKLIHQPNNNSGASSTSASASASGSGSGSHHKGGKSQLLQRRQRLLETI